MTLGELRSHYRREAVGRRLNARDVDLLIGDIFEKPLSWLIAHDDEQVSEVRLTAVREMVGRRLSGEPLQYIRGETEFFGRRFMVDSRALIPRPETEILVETLLSRLKGNVSVLDVGTGTGCIAITAKLECPHVRMTALDQSLQALSLAQQNARSLGAGVQLVGSDLVTAIRGTFDFIVSNPPYVPQGDIASLQIEVRSHEPLMALSPGPTGLECIEQLFRQSRQLLRAGGLLIFEIGYGQADTVRTLAHATGWTVNSVLNDLAAIPRVVISSPS